MKTCTKCDQTLPVENFPLAKDKRDGRSSHCKPCHRSYPRRPKSSEQVKKNNDEAAARRYGLTYDQFLVLREETVCHICGGPPDRRDGARLSVDHCHRTGKYRGMLCTKCNVALGAARDDIGLLKKMILYLEEHDRPEGRR